MAAVALVFLYWPKKAPAERLEFSIPLQEEMSHMVLSAGWPHAGVCLAGSSFRRQQSERAARRFLGGIRPAGHRGRQLSVLVAR